MSWHQVSPSAVKEQVGESQLKPISLFKVNLINCSAGVLWCMMVWITQEALLSPNHHGEHCLQPADTLVQWISARKVTLLSLPY